MHGSWRFCSTLPFPLHLKLTSLCDDKTSTSAARSSVSCPSSSPPPSTYPSSPSSCCSLPAPPFLPTRHRIEKMLTVHPKQRSLSILGPRRELGGMILRRVGPSAKWSKTYPLPCEEGWTKPQLLVEVRACSGMYMHVYDVYVRMFMWHDIYRCTYM